MPIEPMVTHDFDRLLAQWPGFFDALVKHVNDIRQYGTLKQATEEAQKRLADARVADAEFQAEMAGRHAALEEGHAAKDQTLQDAIVARQGEIDRMMIAARHDADELVKTGQRQKDRILAEANVAAAAVDKRVSEAQVQAVSLETAIVNNQQVLADLDKAVKARQKDLDKIEAARQALVAKIAS